MTSNLTKEDFDLIHTVFTWSQTALSEVSQNELPLMKSTAKMGVYTQEQVYNVWSKVINHGNGKLID